MLVSRNFAPPGTVAVKGDDCKACCMYRPGASCSCALVDDDNMSRLMCLGEARPDGQDVVFISLTDTVELTGDDVRARYPDMVP